MEPASKPLSTTEETETDQADVANVYAEQRNLEADLNANPMDVCSKAKQYVLKTRDAAIAAIQAIFADKMTTYTAIKSYNDRSQLACCPQGSPDAAPPLDTGSFFSGGDGRMANCRLRMNFGNKSTTCYSFCPDNWECTSCENPHKILTSHRDEEPPTRCAFLLCDQGGPPSLACKGEDCIPVIRKEFGTLLDLASEFLDITKQYRPCPGTIVAIASATQLAQGGVADYIRDLTTIQGWFQNKFKGEVELVPGPVYLLNGCNSKSLLCAMADFTDWCKEGGEQTSLLLGTMTAALQVALASGTGEFYRLPPRLYRLPADLSGEVELLPWAFTANTPFPAGTKHLSPAKENTINQAFREDLMKKRSLPVGELSVERGLSPSVAAAEARRKKFLVIGASNSERLGSALEARGIKTAFIKTTNWKPGPDAVDALEEHVKSGIASQSPECVIYELLDNLVFLGRSADGTTTLPKRDAKGIYHVSGDLIVADKQVQLNLYKAVRPLLMAAGNRPLIVITPFPRYVSSPCCHEEGHVTNFKDGDYVDSILAQLAEVRVNFKSFLFSDRIRRVNVINPAPLMEDRMTGPYWADPVHPAADSFDRLSELVVESAERLQGKRKCMEEATMVRETRGGWAGSTSRMREWRGPGSQHSSWDQSRGRGGYRGRPGPGRGHYKAGNRGHYRRDSY
jgi:hypothetical protein